MKKIVTTLVVCSLAGIMVWAQPKKPVAKKAATASAGGMQASMVRGQQVYANVCIACHQKDGGGVPRLNPPLIKTTYVLGDKARLIQIVLKGLNQPLEIDDEEYTNPMPPQSNLTDQQIADVLTYVRNSFGNKASAITTAEVRTVRARTK